MDGRKREKRVRRGLKERERTMKIIEHVFFFLLLFFFCSVNQYFLSFYLRRCLFFPLPFRVSSERK